MMIPVWPKRIFFGHAGASLEVARKSAFRNMTRATFLASGHTDNKGAKRGWKLMTEGGWKELLTLLLSQRLEINAIESALKTASILTDAQVKEIRTQASDTAKAWSSKDGDDVLALLRVHSSPLATMSVPRTREQ
jgi:hypothetical protein